MLCLGTWFGTGFGFGFGYAGRFRGFRGVGGIGIGFLDRGRFVVCCYALQTFVFTHFVEVGGNGYLWEKRGEVE